MNATDERGRSALMLAAQKGHARTCRLLLEAGADAALTDADGLDALAHAQPRRHTDVVLAILEHRSRARAPAPLVVSDRSAEVAVPYEASPPIDTSGWEAEPEAVVPRADPQPILASAAIQGAISTHRLIDRDAVWDEVDIQLPEVRHKRGASSDLDEETLACWRALIRTALSVGEVPLSRLLAATIQDAIPVEEAEWLLRETMEEFGVLCDGFEPWVEDAFGSHARGEEEEDEELESRAEAALEHLQALRRDRDRVYWTCVNGGKGQPRLTRHEESVLGAEIEAGVTTVVEALARSRWLRDALVTSLREAEDAPDRGDDDAGSEDAGEDERDPTSTRASSVLCELARARATAASAGRSVPISGEQLRELAAARSPVRRLALDLHRRGSPSDEAVRGFLDGADRWHRAWSNLVVANLRLSVHLVKRSWRHGVPTTDLIQEAHTGLMRAVEKFDLRRGTGFATYAAWWVRARVERHASCATLVRTPALVAETRRKAFQAQRRFEAAGIEFNLADISEEVGAERQAVERALALASEFAPIPRLEDVSDEGGEAIGPELWTPEDLAADSELRRKVMQHLGGLEPREARVLRLRYGFVDGEDRTLSEIGHEIGVSRERVRQIERSALDRLRRHEGIRELVPAKIMEAPDDEQ